MILTIIMFLITVIGALFETSWADKALYITVLLVFLGGILRRKDIF
ncbi:MAG: hypothetical protein ACRC6E_10395 [Fusobacteriaceae bacterium]